MDTAKVAQGGEADDAVSINPVEGEEISPIVIKPSGEELAEGGFVGGLHIGPGGDRLPGSDPLYDGSLQKNLDKKPEVRRPPPVATE